MVQPDGFDALSDALAEPAGSAEIVAAIGGDGTQRTAAHSLKGSSAVLAVVPGGTVNLFGRVLGIESNEDAASAIRSGQRRLLDTGLVDDDTFVLNASTGYDAAVMKRVDDSAKRWGRLGYFATGLRTLSTHRRRHVEVTVDDEVFYAGRAMTVAMARRIWALQRGRTPRSEDLVVAHGRAIDVRWAVAVPAQRDGDATGQVVDVHHRVDPDSLTVCVPAGD